MGRLSLIIGLALLLWNCSSNDVAGGGSETSNISTLTGKVTTVDGEAAVNVEVNLFPVSYIPSSGDTKELVKKVVTDSEGKFKIEVGVEGQYNLVSMGPSQTINLLRGIEITKNDLNNSSLVEVVDQQLKLPSSLKVALIGSNDQSGMVIIPGTGIVQEYFIHSDTIVMDNVPPGILPIIMIQVADDPVLKPITPYEIELKPSEIKTINVNSNWDFQKKIILNTSSTGADVSEDVFDFAVLVRLSRSNFDFSQAQPQGEDIRFTTSSGTVAIFEIQNWDRGNQLANIWVLVDRVFGNDSAQFINMYWGNDTAISSSSRVFSNKRGWSAVWHLEEEVLGDSNVDVYIDATEEANHGDDYVLSSSVSGIIGMGQYFNGADYISISTPSAGLRPTRVEISAWINVEFKGVAGGPIISMSNNYNLRVNSGDHPKLSLYKDSLLVEYFDNSINLVDSTWHLITAQYDETQIIMYIDGILLGTAPYTGGIQYNTTGEFVIGRHASNEPNFAYIGTMDEIRVSQQISEAAKVKLEFENQKPGSSFLNF